MNNTLTDEILSAIDNVDNTIMESEMCVMNSMITMCEKYKCICEYDQTFIVENENIEQTKNPIKIIIIYIRKLINFIKKKLLKSERNANGVNKPLEITETISDVDINSDKSVSDFEKFVKTNSSTIKEDINNASNSELNKCINAVDKAITKTENIDGVEMNDTQIRIGKMLGILKDVSNDIVSSVNIQNEKPQDHHENDKSKNGKIIKTDKKGREIYKRLPNGNEYNTIYDDNGKIIKKYGMEHGKKFETVFTYHKNGNTKTSRAIDGSGVDYDVDRRIIKEISPDGSYTVIDYKIGRASGRERVLRLV